MPKLKIGLEVHGYLNVENRKKLFCDCDIDTEAAPNTNICPVCTSQPGSKPMLPNREALDRIIAIAQMLDCELNRRLLFQRKHYSWPDLPSGYQRTISGIYSFPVGVKGSFLGIRIADVHLEEDPAKWDPDTGFVDYNRSGFPLVEIVTEPDFSSPDQVRDWLKRLMTTLSYIKAVDPDAGIKSDVNVSISPEFRRVEVKNVNSFRGIVATINYEAKRQEAVIASGKKVGRETRAWSEELQETVFMRQKEEAMDYMFIPEPDLPVMHITDANANSILKGLPEKPHQKLERYVSRLKIDRTDAEILSSEILLAELFEKVAEKVSPVLAARWMRRELLRVLHYNKKELGEIKLESGHIVQLLKLVEQKKVTDETAKRLLEKLVEKPFDVDVYIKKEGLAVLSDDAELGKLCDDAIKSNPKAVSDYKKGGERALNFLVGQVVGKTRGRADAKVVREIVLEKLKR